MSKYQQGSPAGKDTAPYHVPVMLQQSIDGLNIRPSGIYVDVTFGGGGHSRGILSRLGEGGRLYGFDQDSDAAMQATSIMASPGEGATGGCFTFVHSNFRYLSNWMRYYGVGQIDGLLADLGVSSHHLDEGDRGFSFRHDAPLDMRMNRDSAVTAADIVNDRDEECLADILHLYGELPGARRIAAAIVRARAVRRITTTGELATVAVPLMARGKKDLPRLFQALRIEVNREMEALRDMLSAAVALLAPGGRLVVITYHSLEDRIVKNVMKTGNAEGKVNQDVFGRIALPLHPIGGKPVTPSAAEIAINPRSRSAKLRVAEKVA